MRVVQPVPNVVPMKKRAKQLPIRSARKSRERKQPASGADEFLPTYDAALIQTGTRGKYAGRYAESSNVVVLDPDVAAAFPNTVAVNEALRGLARIIQDHRSLQPTGSSRRTA